MKLVTYFAAIGLMAATAGCSWFGGDQSSQPGQNVQAPFDNGLRTSSQQPTTCSPADATCGSGLGNPSVQSPAQKRELNVAPQ
jgi:hypothetical protein